MAKLGMGRGALRAAFLGAASVVAVSAAHAATTIDTVSAWNGFETIGSWGKPDTATYGQTFTAPVESRLDSFTFYLNNSVATPFGAYVYAWNGSSITGSALYASGQLTTSGSGTLQPFTINTGGISLTPGSSYVAFFSTSGYQALGGNQGRWGLVGSNPYSGGDFVYYNNGDSFSLLTNSWTVASFFGDLAFTMNFSGLGCPVGAGDDTCLIDSTTNQATAIDADSGTDTLQVGGTTDFNFDVAGIGTTYTNFEVFQKVDASNVTLTGTAGVAANWQVLAGTLTASGGNAIFDTSNVNVSAGATFALAAPETIGSLTGAAGSFVNLGGFMLTAGGDNSSTTFAGVISQNGGLTKVGAGTLTLTGANTYNGSTIVSAGTLAARVSPTQNSISIGPVSIASGATLRLDRSGVGNLFIGNTVTGSGTLNLNFATGAGSNTFLTNIGGFNGTVVLTTTGSTIDKLVVNNGSLSAALVINPGTTLYAQANTTFAGGIAVSGTGNNEGAGAIRFDFGSVVGGNVTLLGDTSVGGLNGGGGLSGTIATGVAGTSTLTAGLFNGNLTFSGAMSNGTGILAMTKVGTGNLTLSGNNTYTGATNVNAGVLRITNGSALGSTAGGTTVAAGAALELQGGISVGAEALTLNGTGVANGGALRNVAGNNTYAGPITLGSASRINSDANSLGITGAVNNGGFLLTVGGAGGTTFSGAAVISGAGGLTKEGTGTASLFMANTYMGVTTVNDGVLQITGGNAIVDTGAVVVNAPGQLQVFASESIGSLASNGSILISGGSTLTTGLDNTNSTFSGVISEQLGSAILIKQGTGNLTLSGANTYSGPTNVNGGTLTLAGGSAIANTGAVTVAGGATLALSASEQIGSLAGAGTLNLGASTLTTGDASNTSFTGTTSGAGGITKVGTGKFTTLALANTGTNTINAGEWNINGNVAGNMVVNAGGTLSGTNTIAGNLTLNAGGTLKSGNSPGTTNVAGNFIGGGSILVEVQFNNAAAPVNGTTHDLLNITGNVSNVTTLNVVPFAPSTAPVATTGNGIEVVRVGGTTAAGAFALSGPVIQGGFQYLLKYLPDYSGTLDGFFLQSAAIQEVSLNAALLGASRASNMACSDRNHGHPGLNGAKGNLWAEGSDDSLKSGAENGVDFDASTNCYRAGFTAQAGGALQVGLEGGISSSSVDVNLPQGLAIMDGDGFAIKANAAYVKDKMFVEGSLGYATTDWSITKAVGAGVANVTLDGLTGHLGAGYRTGLFGPVTATLSAALDYDGTACGSGCLIAGASDETSNWSAGVHARFDAAFSNGRVRPYAQLGLTTDLDGGSSVSFGGATTSVDAMSGLFHGDLGLEASVFSNLSLYAQAGLIEGLDSETTGHSGKVGAKLQW